MSKIINIVDQNNNLIASISKENVVLHNDYKVIETNEDEACYCESDGGLEVTKPEVIN